MIIVNKAGAVAMEASEQFRYEIAPKLGLRDVFKLKRDYLNSRLRFNALESKIFDAEYTVVETDLECPSQEEIDEYIRKRDEYIAEQILKQCGWDEFVKRCKLDNIEDFIDTHMPCDGLGGQCNMACGHWNRCQGYVDIQ